MKGASFPFPYPDVTFEDVFNTLPYEYTADAFRISGAGLLEVLESSAAGEGLFQWSGLRVQLNMSAPEGQRVAAVWVRTKHKQAAADYPALDPNREYHVTTQSVALLGGYSNTRLAKFHTNRTRGEPPIPAGQFTLLKTRNIHVIIHFD